MKGKDGMNSRVELTSDWTTDDAGTSPSSANAIIRNHSPLDMPVFHIHADDDPRYSSSEASTLVPASEADVTEANKFKPGGPMYDSPLSSPTDSERQYTPSLENILEHEPAGLRRTKSRLRRAVDSSTLMYGPSRLGRMATESTTGVIVFGDGRL